MVELIEEVAVTDSTWDIAFNRTNVYLNANDADSQVSVYDTGNNADFYEAEGSVDVEAFTSATPDSELQDYLDVSAEGIPADDNMFTNDVTVKILDDWYNYNFATHEVTAAADKYFVVSNGGVYSKFSVASLTQSGFGASDITLSISYDFADATEVLIDAATECGDASNVYVDFASGSAVAAESAHDIVLTCTDSGFDFDLNLVEGAVATQDFANEITKDLAPYYSYKSNEYQETAFSAFNSYGPWVYAITSDPLMWSQYSVYIIKTADKFFKVQFTSYYNEEGDSGNYSFRADELVVE